MNKMEKNISWTIFILLILTLTINGDILVYRRDSNQIEEEFHDLPARFGATFPISGMRVIPVEARPVNACIPIKPPPSNFSGSENIRWAVLIQRYDCSFELKIRHAQAAGYQAAIVYNVNSNDLEQMSASNDDGINIPSMFIGETTAKIIIYNYVDDPTYGLVLNGDLPFNINTHLILPFSIVVGLCFITMIGFMIVKCVREQRRLRRHRLPGSVLKKIPTIRFAKEQHVALYEICAICLDDYVDGDKLRVLPCAHAYHTKCIDPWLTKNRRVCPICKRKVFARGEPRQRIRRSSDDSMSDSDGDDTTPLLNPVDHSNHGTFTRSPTEPASSAVENMERTAAGYQQQRYNPFDRQVQVPVVPEDIETIPSVWKRFFGIFQSTPNADDQLQSGEVYADDSGPIQPQTHENDAIDVLIDPSQRSSSSNNILNSNLSGSFKKCKPHSQQNQTEFDDDDDDDNINGSIEPSRTIYAPISTSQPQFLQPKASTSSHQRIAVAAIPNVNLQQPMLRAVSSSSPSVYSTNRRNSNSESSNGDADDTQTRPTGNFNRAAASSTDYFV